MSLMECRFNHVLADASVDIPVAVISVALRVVIFSQILMRLF